MQRRFNGKDGERYAIIVGRGELILTRKELDNLLCRLIDPEGKLL